MIYARLEPGKWRCCRSRPRRHARPVKEQEKSLREAFADQNQDKAQT
jgi:hypothetical protein